MSKQLFAEIEIDAPPERVWQVLVDLPAYPDWNPFIVGADGRPEESARLTLRMQPVGARAVTLRPTVVEVTPGQRLRWLGRVGVPGIFDADHVLTVAAAAGGGTLFSQSEVFRGVLVPILARSLDRHTLPAFRAMNEALKDRAELPVESRLA
jgi:hypothetical protein